MKFLIPYIRSFGSLTLFRMHTYIHVVNPRRACAQRGLLTLGAHAHSEGYSSCRVCMCVCVCVYVCTCVRVYVCVCVCDHS